MLKRISLQSWGWECFKQDTNGTNNNKKRNLIHLIALKLRTSVYQKIPLRERKERPQNGRRYLQYL